MMKFLILSILVAVCYAQTPARPVIPETFVAQVEAVFHERETVFGEGMIARDQMKNEGVEDLHSKQEGRNETRILLERYDMGEDYYIRGFGGEEHCEVRKTNGTEMPPYWGWVQDAKYVGKKEIHEMMMDIWEYQGPGVRVDLLVGEEDPNVPRYLNAEVGTSRRELTFMKFDAVTPDAGMFTVPDVCKE